MSVQLVAVGKIKKLKDCNTIYKIKKQNEILTKSLQNVTYFPTMDLMQNTQICETQLSPTFNLVSAVKLTFRYCGCVCGSE
jgi:hypothetical protein